MKGRRTILVTGANSEIGVSVCQQFLDTDNSVIAMVHRSNDRLESISSSRLNIVKVDFSDHENIEKFIDENSELLDSVDVFISLASVRNSVNYGVINGSDLIHHFTVNSIPTILLVQYLGNSMSKKGWGRIVIGSSIGVKFGGGMDSYCYSLTKYASELIPNIAKQWSRKGILINVVRIGVTDTKKFCEIGKNKVESRVSLIPMRRLANQNEIGRAIYWLGSEDNTYITGQVIPVSGGE